MARNEYMGSLIENKIGRGVEVNIEEDEMAHGEFMHMFEWVLIYQILYSEEKWSILGLEFRAGSVFPIKGYQTSVIAATARDVDTETACNGEKCRKHMKNKGFHIVSGCVKARWGLRMGKMGTKATTESSVIDGGDD